MAYAEYCRKHKLKMVNDKMIREILSTYVGVGEAYKKIETKQVWTWLGIKLKTEEKKEIPGETQKENIPLEEEVRKLIPPEGITCSKLQSILEKEKRLSPIEIVVLLDNMKQKGLIFESKPDVLSLP
jgi:hypothetical protein